MDNDNIKKLWQDINVTCSPDKSDFNGSRGAAHPIKTELRKLIEKNKIIPITDEKIFEHDFIFYGSAVIAAPNSEQEIMEKSNV